MRDALHLPHVRLLDGPVKPQVPAPTRVARIEVHDISAHALADRAVVLLCCVDASAFQTEELRSHRRRAPLGRVPYEALVRLGAYADDERPQPQRGPACPEIREALDCLQPLLRTGDSDLDLRSIIRVFRDDGELDVPVLLSPEQVRISLVFQPPRALRAERDRVVDLLEEPEKLQRLPVELLVTVELVAQPSPLDGLALFKIRAELALLLSGKDAFDLVHVDALDVLAEVHVTRLADAPLVLREAVDAAKRAVRVGVERHRQRAVRYLASPPRTRIPLLALAHLMPPFSLMPVQSFLCTASG